MRTLLRITGALGLFAIAAFCAFGFMATFEPSASPRWPWQVGYGLIGLASLGGAIFLLRSKRNRGASGGNRVQPNR
jgi:LPXTG-motif cell wall-anchored protein